jgi:hypothetical protein
MSSTVDTPTVKISEGNLDSNQPANYIEGLITNDEYSQHMQLSLSQLETVALMLQVLDQADGGPIPTK